MKVVGKPTLQNFPSFQTCSILGVPTCAEEFNYLKLLFSIPASLKLSYTVHHNKYSSNTKAVARGTWRNFLTSSSTCFPKCSRSKFLVVTAHPLGRDRKHWSQDNDSWSFWCTWHHMLLKTAFRSGSDHFAD